MSLPFKVGDILVLNPKDELDPDANNNKGKRCQFLRYSVLRDDYIVVKFSTQGKPMTFRAQDFEKADDQKA